MYNTIQLNNSEIAGFGVYGKKHEDPEKTRDKLINASRKKDFKSVDFSDPEKMEKSLDYKGLSYSDIYVIIERAIQQNGYNLNGLLDLARISRDGRLRLAVIENMEQFKNKACAQEAMIALKDIVINYFKNPRDYRDNIYPDDPAIIMYGTDYDDDEIYDLLVSTCLEKLKSFGSEAEEILIQTFFDFRKKVREVNDNIYPIDDIKDIDDKIIDTSFDDYYLDDEGDVIDDSGTKSEIEIGYRYNSKILDYLSDIGKRKSIDFVVDFVKKDDFSTWLYKKELVNILENDKQYSAEILLELLKNSSSEISKRAGNLLYRLEIGQIGISEEGVRYLEKLYDLGELNQPGYFAQRLTAKGDIGVFDDEKILQKYFNLGDLSSPEKIIRPEIYEITCEMLFKARKGETKEGKEEREKYLQEFKENYFGLYNDNFFQQTGVRFNNLNFREQGWFLIFYQKADDSIRRKLIDFTKRFGENGFRTFLSLESGRLSGEDIIKIGNSLKKESGLSDKIFKKYADIIDQLNAFKAQPQGFESFGMWANEEDYERINQALINKANELLLGFLEIIESRRGANKDELIDKLNQYEENLLLNISVYKSADKSKVKLEEIPGVSLKKNSAEDYTRNGEFIKQAKDIFESGIKGKTELIISGAILRGATQEAIKYIKNIEAKQRVSEILEMLSIYAENYKGKPELQKKLMDNFLNKLEQGGDNVSLYIYKNNGKIIAFNRFDTTPNGKYFGSFNVAPVAHGSAIGYALLQSSLEKEAKDSDIEGDCEPEKAISSDYIEKYGFVARKYYSDYAGLSMPAFNIFRSKQNEKFNFRDKDLASDDLIEEFKRDFPDNKEKTAEKQFLMKFKNNSKEFHEAMERIINQKGYTMTRYIMKGDDVYCAFERGES